jgi:hypothetical protein
MERETGIEPATNSLEGCDSTIELLPPESCRDSGAFHGTRVSILEESFPLGNPPRLVQSPQTRHENIVGFA